MKTCTLLNFDGTLLTSLKTNTACCVLSCHVVDSTDMKEISIQQRTGKHERTLHHGNNSKLF